MTHPEISAAPRRVAHRHVIVTLPSEIDLLNAPAVSDSLLAVLNHEAAGVIADMTCTRFCDAAGCRVVGQASRRARLLSVSVQAVIADPSVRKVFRLTGADQVVSVCATLDEALRCDVD